MYFIFIVTLGFILSFGALKFEHDKKIQNPSALNTNEFYSYRMFVYAADQYIKNNPFSSESTTIISWETIKNSPTTPPGMKNNNIPSNWVVKGNNQNWVFCAELSDATIGLIKTAIPNKDIFPSSNQNHVVIGAINATESNNLSNLCS